MLAQPDRVDGDPVSGHAGSLTATLDHYRHKIPFWWWLTYDAAVAAVIAFGVSPSDPAFWLGYLVLAVAVAIDAVEFWVKRPSARPPAPPAVPHTGPQ